MYLFGQNHKVAILSQRRSRATVASLWPANGQSRVSAREALAEATVGQRRAITVPRVVIHTESPPLIRHNLYLFGQNQKVAGCVFSVRAKRSLSSLIAVLAPLWPACGPPIPKATCQRVKSS